jgi:hypothetical protein
MQDGETARRRTFKFISPALDAMRSIKFAIFMLDARVFRHPGT